MQRHAEYRAFGSQVGYVIAAHLAGRFLSLVRIPILTKALGATLYGTWSLISVTVSLVVPFAMLGLSMGVVRFLSAQKNDANVREDFSSALSTVFISGAAFSVLLFALADYLAVSILKDPGAALYVRLGSVLILLNSLQPVVLAFFRMRRRIGLYSTLSISQNVLQIGLLAAAIALGYSLYGAITATIASITLVTVVALLLIFREIGVAVPRFSNIKSYLRWGVPLTPNTALVWVMHTSDRYMVSYFLGVGAAGVYSASYGIGDYATFALAPLLTVLFPHASKTYDEGSPDETRSYLKHSLRYLMMISIPAAFGLSVLAKPLLQILTTPEFVAGSIVVPWVAFGTVLFAFRQICNLGIYMVNRTRISTALLGVSAALNVVLNLLLIPRVGILGAAVATLISYAMLAMLTLLVTRRYLKFDLSLHFIGKSLVSAGIMALCIGLIHPQSLWPVLICIVLGAVIYFAVLMALKGLSKGELIFFAGFVRDNLRKIGLFKR